VREPEKFANEKKVKNKGHESYISHVRVDWTSVGSMMKIGALADIPDVMNRVNFHLHRMI
jgi:hypothetical protein